MLNAEAAGRRFAQLFRAEAAALGMPWSAGVFWHPGAVCCRLGQGRDGSLRAEVNLRTGETGAARGREEQERMLRFLARWSALRLRNLSRAAVTEPGSYLQGLAILEDLDRGERPFPLCLCLPGKKRPRGRFRLTPADLAAGAEAEKSLGFRVLPAFPAQLPEVGYYGTAEPASSLVRLLERLPETGKRFPDAPAVRALFENGRPLTLRELAGREGAFEAGVLLRLGGTGTGKALHTAAETFARQTAALIQTETSRENWLLRDLRAAAEQTAAGIRTGSGTCGIHLLGDGTLTKEELGYHEQ